MGEEMSGPGYTGPPSESMRLRQDNVRLVRVIAGLEAIIIEAIPFIGYEAYVPDILERAMNAVNYGEKK